MKSDQDSGWKWGPFNLIDDPKHQGRRPLFIEQKGGCVRYPYKTGPGSGEKQSQHISQVDTTKPIIHKGNHFGHFTHFRDYPKDCEVYFWDNCLLPELMYKTEANPQGGKHWARLVYRSTMPSWNWASETVLDQHADRVNRRLQSMSQGKITDYQQLMPVKECQVLGRTMLLSLCSEMALRHWYGITHSELIAGVQKECERQNLELVIRPKPDRTQRDQGRTIRAQLQAQQFRAVITVNSAAAIECLAEGVPVVTLGAHSLGGQGTAWSQFCQGWFNQPCREHVEYKQRQMLTMTWHKEELLDGTWNHYRDHIQNCDPYQDWTRII